MDKVHNAKLSAHFGSKKMHICCLLVSDGARCENPVSLFISSVRFVNVLRIALRHPQVYWNPYLLLIEGLDHSQWTLLLGYFYVQMVVTLFSHVLII